MARYIYPAVGDKEREAVIIKEYSGTIDAGGSTTIGVLLVSPFTLRTLAGTRFVDVVILGDFPSITGEVWFAKEDFTTKIGDIPAGSDQFVVLLNKEPTDDYGLIIKLTNTDTANPHDYSFRILIRFHN